MFRSTSLFIGTSFTVAVFTIFATSNVDSIVGISHKIYSMQRILIHIKANLFVKCAHLHPGYAANLVARSRCETIFWPPYILTPGSIYCTIFWPRGQYIVTIFWPPSRYFDPPSNSIQVELKTKVRNESREKIFFILFLCADKIPKLQNTIIQLCSHIIRHVEHHFLNYGAPY